MKCLGVNCFRCRVMRYDGQVGFAKLGFAESQRSKKLAFATANLPLKLRG